MNQTITRELAKKMLYGIESTRIFSAEFTKKNGDLRKMVCMKGVKKGLKGGTIPYNPKDKDLIPVYDVAIAKSGAKARRMINIAGLQALVIDGNRFDVVA